MVRVQVVFYKFKAKDLRGHAPGEQLSEDEAEDSVDQGGELEPNETAENARDALKVGPAQRDRACMRRAGHPAQCPQAGSHPPAAIERCLPACLRPPVHCCTAVL